MCPETSVLLAKWMEKFQGLSSINFCRIVIIKIKLQIKNIFHFKFFLKTCIWWSSLERKSKSFENVAAQLWKNQALVRYLRSYEIPILTKENYEKPSSLKMFIQSFNFLEVLLKGFPYFILSFTELLPLCFCKNIAVLKLSFTSFLLSISRNLIHSSLQIFAIRSIKEWIRVMGEQFSLRSGSWAWFKRLDKNGRKTSPTMLNQQQFNEFWSELFMENFYV